MLSPPSQREGAQKLLDMAKELEHWAIGAIDVAREPRQAHRVLEFGLANDNTCTALDMAVKAGAKPFLTESHCISLMDAWWRGKGVTKHELPPDFSYAWVAIEVLFPFLTPHCREFFRREGIETDRDKETPSARGHEDILGGQSRADQDLSIMLRAIRFASAGAEDEKGRLGESAKRQPSSRVRHKFHKYSITHQVNAEKTLSEEGETIHSFFHVPAVKFTVRFICHLVAITLYVVLIFESTYKLRLDIEAPELPLLSKDMKLNEIAWLLFSLGIWLDQQHQHMRLKQLSTGVRAFSGIWKVVEVMLLLIFVTRFAMEIVCLEAWCEGCKTGDLPVDDSMGLSGPASDRIVGYDELPFMCTSASRS